MEDYIKCEQRGGESPRHLTLSNVSIVAVHYTHQHVLCIDATVDCSCIPCCPLRHAIS